MAMKREDLHLGQSQVAGTADPGAQPQPSKAVGVFETSRSGALCQRQEFRPVQAIRNSTDNP